MDKQRAFAEIETILYSKNLTLAKQKEEIREVLEKMSDYTYNWGRRQGMFCAINKLTDIVENTDEFKNK